MSRGPTNLAGHAQRTYHISVVGLSGFESNREVVGVGKSSLCNRFVRPHADDYQTDHITTISDSDFSGQIINNNHWLFWGLVTKPNDDGTPVNFCVVEQTEFVDDSSFRPFPSSGKSEKYEKRCAELKLTSAEKLMYICKDQLCLQDDFDKVLLPSGKINIDGFVVVYDVSTAAYNRDRGSQQGFIYEMLTNLAKTKRPIIVAATKCDDRNDSMVEEVKKLVQRREFRAISLHIIETSADMNINVDSVFFNLVHLIDKSRNRLKIINYLDAEKIRKSQLQEAKYLFKQFLHHSQLDDHQSWNEFYSRYSGYPELSKHIHMIGTVSTTERFHEYLSKLVRKRRLDRISQYRENLPLVLKTILPDLDLFENLRGPLLTDFIQQHEQFDKYFIDFTGAIENIPPSEERIPIQLLENTDGSDLLDEHIRSLQREQRRDMIREKFLVLLRENTEVEPGKPLEEVSLSREAKDCSLSLSPKDKEDVYKKYQEELRISALREFRELLLERADVFYDNTSNSDQMEEIIRHLEEEPRYRALRYLSNDRYTAILRHVNFIGQPLPQNCSSSSGGLCIDDQLQREVVALCQRLCPGTPTFSAVPFGFESPRPTWLSSSGRARRKAVSLQVAGLETDWKAFKELVKTHCPLQEFRTPNMTYRLKCDYSSNVQCLTALTTSDETLPCVLVYTSSQGFKLVKRMLTEIALAIDNKTLDLDSNGSGVKNVYSRPKVVFYLHGDMETNKDLRRQGQMLAQTWGCQFIESNTLNSTSDGASLTSVLRHLLFNSDNANRSLPPPPPQIPPPPIPAHRNDANVLNVTVCVMCGDLFSMNLPLEPLVSALKLQQTVTGNFETSWPPPEFHSSYRGLISLKFASYHQVLYSLTPQNYLPSTHAIILVYWTARLASLSTLRALCHRLNPPTPPMLVVGVGVPLENREDYLEEGRSLAATLEAGTPAHFLYIQTEDDIKDQTETYLSFFEHSWAKKPQEAPKWNRDLVYDTPRTPYDTIAKNERKANMPLGIIADTTHSPPVQPTKSSTLLSRVDNLIRFRHRSTDNLRQPTASSRDHSSSVSSVSPRSSSNPPVPLVEESLTGQLALTLPPSPLFIMPPTPDSGNQCSCFSNISWRHPMSMISYYDQNKNTYYSTPFASGSQGTHEPIYHEPNRHLGLSRNSGLHRSKSSVVEPPRNFASHTRSHSDSSESQLPLATGATENEPKPGKTSADIGNIEMIYAEARIPNQSSANLGGGGVIPEPTVVRRPNYFEENIYAEPVDAVQQSVKNAYVVPWNPDPRNFIQNLTSPLSQRRATSPQVLVQENIPYYENKGAVSPSDSLDKLDNSRTTEQPKMRWPTTPDSQPPQALTTSATHESISSSATISDLRRVRRRSMSGPVGGKAVSSPPGASQTIFLGLTETADFQIHNETPTSKEDDVNPSSRGNVRRGLSFLRAGSERRKNRQAATASGASPYSGGDKGASEDKRTSNKDEKKQVFSKKDKKHAKKLASKTPPVGSPVSRHNSEVRRPTVASNILSEANAAVLLRNPSGESPALTPFVEQCTRFVEAQGMHQEGIYRVPGNKSDALKLLAAFHEDSNQDLGNLGVDVTVVTSLLKLAFKGTGVIPSNLHASLKQVFATSSKDQLRINLQSVLTSRLPPHHLELVVAILKHLAKLSAQQKWNKMDAHNMAVCWCPSFFILEVVSVEDFNHLNPIFTTILEVLIEDVHILFPS